MNRKYSWIPDVPDFRDFRLAAPLEPKSLPPKYDMRKTCPPVFDQKTLGSCTANAVCAAMQFTQIEQKQAGKNLSRLFVYYNTRLIQGTIEEDSGASLRDSIKSVAKYGACLETVVPYKIRSYAVKPPAAAYTKAEANKIKAYARVPQRLPDLKAVLSANNPVVFGFAVYDEFEGSAVAKTGILNMPDFEKEKMNGGHAVTLVGYDDTKSQFIVRNSWGDDWGDGGYFYMPYAYVLDNNLADDFWTITAVP